MIFTLESWFFSDPRRVSWTHSGIQHLDNARSSHARRLLTGKYGHGAPWPEKSEDK